MTTRVVCPNGTIIQTSAASIKHQGVDMPAVSEPEPELASSIPAPSAASSTEEQLTDFDEQIKKRTVWAGGIPNKMVGCAQRCTHFWHANCD